MELSGERTKLELHPTVPIPWSMEAEPQFVDVHEIVVAVGAVPGFGLAEIEQVALAGTHARTGIGDVNSKTKAATSAGISIKITFAVRVICIPRQCTLGWRAEAKDILAIVTSTTHDRRLFSDNVLFGAHLLREYRPHSICNAMCDSL